MEKFVHSLGVMNVERILGNLSPQEERISDCRIH